MSTCRRIARFAAASMAAASLLAASLTAQAQEVNASGVFLNDAGEVLTARHAVANCHSLFVVKDGRAVEATVRVLSPDLDVAVLRSTLKPYLSATFAQTTTAPAGSTGVFTEAYSLLQRMPDRASVLSNAMTIPGSEDMQLLSDAQPGASGSAVLGAGGLLLGVVVERIAAAPGSTGLMLSRSPNASRPVGATRVRAVTAARIKNFLRDNGVAFSESDTPQLGPLQSPAARAATLSVGVLCG
jgi:serine protease DegQ